MALDSYVGLGRSGLKVSPFCLGAMNFGEDGGFGCGVEDTGEVLPDGRTVGPHRGLGPLTVAA
ncbi:hypothetical protein [Streptomyces sp. NPDC002619]|uniref:hypothetical protein n=1 Tax=Streptomyces sp. NPDC002619 TaxID=3364655 RepID=UPI00368F38E8